MQGDTMKTIKLTLLLGLLSLGMAGCVVTTPGPYAYGGGSVRFAYHDYDRHHSDHHDWDHHDWR